MKNVKKRTFQLKRYETLSSTNTELKKVADRNAPWFTIMTDNQTKGRGRHQRSWISEKGKDLTFSTLFPVDAALQKYLPNITQIAALAVIKAIESVGVSAKIKWPNDILVHEKKICGILVEGISTGSEQKIIIGIGLNVNSKAHTLDSIDTTSLLNETGILLDLEMLLEKVVTELQALRDLLSQKGIHYFHPMLNYYLAYKNEQRTVIINAQALKATIVSVAKSGALQIMVDDTIKEITSGEISFKTK